MTQYTRIFQSICCLAVVSLLVLTGRARADLLDGLSFYWPLDSNMADLGGSAQHGTPIGDATITHTVGQYQFGSGGLYLDGDGDYVDILSEVFPDGAETFTVSAWANLQGLSVSTQPTSRTVWSTASTAYASEFGLRAGDAATGYPHWFNQGVVDYNLNPGMVINTNEWHEYAVSWNKTEGRMRYYVDGVQVHEITGLSGYTPVATDGFHIGADRAGDREFNGYIDDVAVWSRELDPTEVAQLATGAVPVPGPTIVPVAPNGLLAQYTFETSGGVAVGSGQSAIGQVDDSADHLDGVGTVDTSSAHITYSSNASPDPGSSYSLSFGSPESHTPYYAHIPVTSSDALGGIALNDDFRIEAWFATTDTGRAVLAGSYYAGSPATAINLELHTSNRGRLYLQGSAVTDLTVTLPTDSRDGQWHQLVGVRDDGTLRLYYDGVEIGTKADASGNYGVTSSDFYLGRDARNPSAATDSTDFTGYLDAVRFYSAANADPNYLIAAYEFEEVGGVSVYDGLAAQGTIADSTGSFNAIGEPPIIEPIYQADAPGVLADSTHSLQLDEGLFPQSIAIGITPELAAVTEGDFAVETWFKTTDEGRGILIGCLDFVTENSLNLELHEGNDVRIYIDGNGTTSATISDLRVDAPAGINTRDGEWHHLVGQREGTEVSLWVDGLLAGTMTDVAGDFTLTPDTFYLGRDTRTDTTRFDGSLDNVRIWGRALSEEEIQSLALGAVPVPEPAGIVLMLFGLAALYPAIRRGKAIR